MKLSIIVPCYNEADNIHKLQNEFFPVVESLIGKDLPDGEGSIERVQVVFVDDGSRDDTWDVLHRAFGRVANSRVEVVFQKHPVNRGLGAALRTGFMAADGDLLITTDSDGTYHFSTIPDLLARMTAGVDLVTASPYHPQGEVVGVPGYRIFLSRGSSLLYRLLLNWNIHTYTALFRAYRKKVIESVVFEADDYLAGTEIMVKAMLQGFKVVEYPAALHRRMFGVSKAKLARTILSHLRFQARLLLHRLGIQSMLKNQA